MSTVGDVGSVLSGVGKLGSAIFGGGATQTGIDPQVAAELEAQGLDINRFLANLQERQFLTDTPFNQAMAKYAAQSGALSQDFLNKMYGGAEEGAGAFAKRALSGELSPVSENLLRGVDVQTGQGSNMLKSQIMQNLAAQGIDPDSPAAQQIFAQEMRKYGVDQSQNRTALEEGIRQSDLATANNLLSGARNAPRLAGQGTPDMVQTQAEQEAAAKEAVAAKRKEMMGGKYAFMGRNLLAPSGTSGLLTQTGVQPGGDVVNRGYSNDTNQNSAQRGPVGVPWGTIRTMPNGKKAKFLNGDWVYGVM